jgi:hypothetical protein
MPRTFEAVNRVALNEDKAAACRGPDEVGLEPAQADIRQGKMPGGRGRRRRGRPKGQGQQTGGVEQAVRVEGVFVALEDEGKFPPLPLDEEQLRAEVGARPAVEPQVPDGPEERPDEAGRGSAPAEVFERATAQQLPENTVDQGELRRGRQRPSLRGPAVPLQDLLGQGGQGDEAKVDPGTGVPRQSFPDLASDDEGRNDEDLFVEGVLAAEGGEETDGRVRGAGRRLHIFSGIR